MEQGAAPDAEDLYDGFLDACAQGSEESPEAYLARFAVRDADLLARLRDAARLRDEGREVARRAGAPVPDRIGPYRVLGRLGEGGMGTVYVAEQESLHRRVALKVMRAELAGSEELLRRFEREARAIARLRHPNIVSVYEMGAHGSLRYIAMELVPGRPLSEVLRDGIPPIARTLAWGTALAHALACAHEQSLVHRDVKPGNVIVTPDDRPVLLDFGIARWTGPDATRLTQSFAGSPLYAAPEQISGEADDVDGRTDVYALGVTLYECLTGRVPFEGGAVAAIFQRILTEEPPSLRRRNPEVNASCEAIVLKALEKRREARYASAAEMAQDLEALSRRHPVRARRPGYLKRLGRAIRRRPARATAIAGTLAVAASFVGVVAWRRGEEAQARRAEAAALLRSASDAVDRFRDHRLAIRDRQSRYGEMERERIAQYYSEGAEKEFQRFSREVERLHLERESLYTETLESLSRAERLDPDVSGDAIRARLHLQRVEEAYEAADPAAARFHEAMARRFDPDGRLTAQLRPSGSVRVHAEPAGAEVHLFRYVEQADVVEGGDRRLVPVPAGPRAGESPPAGLPPPGTWAMRVARGAGPVAVGDVVLTVDGLSVDGTVLVGDDVGPLRAGDVLTEFEGRRVRVLADAKSESDGPYRVRIRRGDEDLAFPSVPDGMTLQLLWEWAEDHGGRARLVHDGATVEVAMPPRVVLRPTAAPRFLCAASRVVAGTEGPVALAPGSYACVVQAEGREPAVAPFDVAPGADVRLEVTLPDAKATPPEFVFVWNVKTPSACFYLGESEVTAEEYLQFLNDPATLAEIGTKAIRYPRNASDAARGGLWARLPDGRFELRTHGETTPVFGVSWDDAKAYVVWRSRRDGRPYALPTLSQWLTACQGSSLRRFCWGDFFCPHWTKSCFSRPPPIRFEPVMSYPVDETVGGAYDTAGSVAEWLETWYDESRKLRWLDGGAWGQALPETFRIWGGNGFAATDSHYESGFRLVLPVGASDK